MTDYSLRKEEKKSIGGLVESKISSILINTNTIEEFTTADFDAQAEKHLRNNFLDSKEWQKDTSFLNKFLIFSFADLKSYLYRYQIISLCPISDFTVEIQKSKRVKRMTDLPL
jgi:hypothetical protein